MKKDEKLVKIFGKKINDIRKNLSIVSDDPLEIKMDIDRSKYGNVVLSYGAVIKKMFSSKEVYCLTRIKENKNISSLFAILFRNSKKAVMSEMKSFSPTFLVKCNGLDLLVVQNTRDIHMYEIEKVEGDSFVFRGYRYKIANKIKLK